MVAGSVYGPSGEASRDLALLFLGRPQNDL